MIVQLMMYHGLFQHPATYKLKNAYNLKQVVDKPTKENRILGKALTSMHSHYNRPDVFSPIISADHNIVVYSPRPDYLSPEPIIIVVYSPHPDSPEPIIKDMITHNNGKNQ